MSEERVRELESDFVIRSERPVKETPPSNGIMPSELVIIYLLLHYDYYTFRILLVALY